MATSEGSVHLTWQWIFGDLGFRVEDLGFRDLGFKVLGLRVEDLGFRDFGLRV